MDACPTCGGLLSESTSPWGKGVCGECLADGVELTLMRMNGLLGERKPLKRAASAEVVPEPVPLTPERKSA